MLIRDKNRIHNPNDDRIYTTVGVVQYLAVPVTLTVYQHRIADASISIIQRDEISTSRLVFIKRKWLNNQQPTVLKMRVTDSGNDGSNNFANNHRKRIPLN